MERIHERQKRPTPPQAGGGVPMQAAVDVAATARAAAADAAAIPPAPHSVTVQVKTTGTHSTRIVATPDTPMADILAQACRDLEVHDAAQYLLVARGEVINEGWPLAQVVGDKPGEAEITMRLVKKPEAGTRPCRY